MVCKFTLCLLISGQECHNAVADPYITGRMVPIPDSEAKNYSLATKLHENQRNWVGGAGPKMEVATLILYII